MTDKLKRGLTTTTAAGVLGIGLIVPALAQDSGTTTDEPTSREEPAETGQDRRAGLDSEFAAALASELGIDESTVAEAISAVRDRRHAEMQARRRAALEERLSSAVTEGTITQSQADAVVAALDADAIQGPGGSLRDRLAAAVEAGELTQQQADAVLEVAEAGVLRVGHRDGWHRDGWHRRPGARFHGPADETWTDGTSADA